MIKEIVYMIVSNSLRRGMRYSVSLQASRYAKLKTKQVSWRQASEESCCFLFSNFWDY